MNNPSLSKKHHCVNRGKKEKKARAWGAVNIVPKSLADEASITKDLGTRVGRKH